MNRDPIVEEIRQARQKNLDECGGDLNKLLDRLKSIEAESVGPVVSANSVRSRRETPPLNKR